MGKFYPKTNDLENRENVAIATNNPKRTKLLIDARVLDHTNAGIAVVLRELFPYFKNTSANVSVLHKDQAACKYYDGLGYEWIRCKYSLTDNMIKSIIETQGIINRGEWDVFFSPIWFPRLIYHNKKIKMIVMMHDLIYLEESKSRLRFLKSYVVTLYGGFLANKILTVSENSKKEIINRYPFFSTKIKVCPNPLPIKKMQSIDPYVIDKYKLNYQGYFLFVSAMREYKGFNQTLEAFLAFSNAKFKLVIVGKPDVGEMLPSVSSLTENIIFAGYVKDEELNALYRNAFALVFPSRIEGFGLPILEAQYHGCPVIATAHPALIETAGEGALFIKSQNPLEIKEAMEILVLDSRLREAIIKNGKKNIERFDSAKICLETIKNIMSDNYIESHSQKVPN